MTAGFRWGLITARGGSPFECKTCSDADRGARNCANRLGLTDSVRAVEGYTPEVAREHREKEAKKVFRLGGLRLYECPLSYLSEETAEVMRLVYLVDGSGALLHPGGWGAQPPWLVEAYEIYRVETFQNIKDGKDGQDRS